MDITKQQRVELNTQGWDIYENGYTIPLYADEIENLYENLLDLGFNPDEAGKLALLKFGLMGEMGYDKREPELPDGEEDA